jgi:hypothetical protein
LRNGAFLTDFCAEKILRRTFFLKNFANSTKSSTFATEKIANLAQLVEQRIRNA